MPRSLSEKEERKSEKYRKELIELKATLLRMSGEFQTLSKKFEDATLVIADLRNQLNTALNFNAQQAAADAMRLEIAQDPNCVQIHDEIVHEVESDRDQSQQV